MSLTLREGRDCLLLCGISKEGHIGMEMLFSFQFSAAFFRLLNQNVFNLFIVNLQHISVDTTILYLLNFNIKYIIILATCFDSYESSSGINFQELLYIFFYSFMSYSAQKTVRHKNCKTICTIVLEN